LFSQVGTVKNVHIDYDRAGRSNGTAKVVFSSKRDALVASDRFHHMPLDGCPMQIEILSSSAHQERGSFRVHDRHRNTPQNMGIRKAAFKSRNTHEPSRQGTRSRAPTGRSTPTNAAALDAELDNYMMQQ
jgi:RNA recognition motif-containing protein